MKKFNVNGNIILANDAAEAVKKFKDAKIELDWASDEDAQRFATKFNCTAKRAGSANGYPVYIFEGDKKNLEQLTKVYGMDKEDFNNFVKDDELDDLSKEEKQAIEDYRKAIENTKNPKLLELYAHILQEETEHLKELQAAK